jgi:hypothetical protein
MENWVLSYVVSDWWNLLVGGVLVVSIVIFLMGVLKGVVVNQIKNHLIRKVILAWGSLLLTVAVTLITSIFQEFAVSVFAIKCVLNCIGTILTYWVYENTALRDSLSIFGKKILTKLVFCAFQSKDAKKTIDTVSKDVESWLTDSASSRYKDDDIKKL